MLTPTTLVTVVIALLIVVTIRSAVKIVPQSENWLVERLGKYHRKMEAGLHLLVPFFETVRYKVPIQERQLPPKPINAITLDNVTISVSLAVLYRIADASKTMYRISNVDDAIITIVNGTVRSVIGKTDLDGVQSNRRQLSIEIEDELKTVSDEWGSVTVGRWFAKPRVRSRPPSSMPMPSSMQRNGRPRPKSLPPKRRPTLSAWLLRRSPEGVPAQ
jgi:regulator of protease activity HflC (stomatin/prohibitin superfamily)